MSKKKSRKSEDQVSKIHPWRFCPSDQHWVRTHPLHIRPSKAHPQGGLTTRHAHCAHNPSGRDRLDPVEIEGIAEKYFPKLKGPPCQLNLDFGESGSKYDDLIRGWTQYWNEVLQPKVPLDPNLVKALIASESSFDPKSGVNKKGRTRALGLMQLTPEAAKTLGNENGEIKDHYITLSRSELLDPDLNICGGIRWLFQKQVLATHRVGRDATGDEAIEEYKGILGKLLAGKKVNPKIMENFRQYLKDYTECREDS